MWPIIAQGRDHPNPPEIPNFSTINSQTQGDLRHHLRLGARAALRAALHTLVAVVEPAQQGPLELERAQFEFCGAHRGAGQGLEGAGWGPL